MSTKKVYEHVTPVEIVREERWGWLTGACRIGELFFSAWIAMLALGALVPFHAAHLGYWATVFGVWALRNLKPTNHYLSFTRARKRVKS